MLAPACNHWQYSEFQRGFLSEPLPQRGRGRGGEVSGARSAQLNRRNFPIKEKASLGSNMNPPMSLYKSTRHCHAREHRRGLSKVLNTGMTP